MRQVSSIGKRCPQPIIDLARAMRENPEEKEFELLSDDPATLSDLSAWARMTKNSIRQLDPHTFAITRGEARVTS